MAELESLDIHRACGTCLDQVSTVCRTDAWISAQAYLEKMSCRNLNTMCHFVDMCNDTYKKPGIWMCISYVILDTIFFTYVCRVLYRVYSALYYSCYISVSCAFVVWATVGFPSGSWATCSDSTYDIICKLMPTQSKIFLLF